MFVTIPNVLANRYASAEMVAIWSLEAKVVAERRLWLAVLRAQAELGVEVPEAARMFFILPARMVFGTAAGRGAT